MKQQAGCMNESHNRPVVYLSLHYYLITIFRYDTSPRNSLSDTIIPFVLFSLGLISKWRELSKSVFSKFVAEKTLRERSQCSNRASFRFVPVKLHSVKRQSENTASLRFALIKQAYDNIQFLHLRDTEYLFIS